MQGRDLITFIYNSRRYEDFERVLERWIEPGYDFLTDALRGGDLLSVKVLIDRVDGVAIPHLEFLRRARPRTNLYSYESQPVKRGDLVDALCWSDYVFVLRALEVNPLTESVHRVLIRVLKLDRAQQASGI